MGKREGFRRPICYDKSRLQRRTMQTSQNLFWVPKIAAWEKEFCYKIGLFTWEKFLEAKKVTRGSHKILNWNDSAAEEAFHRSKNRFFAIINGLSISDDDFNPDLYIDEIHWDDEDLEFESARGGTDVEEEEDENDQDNEEEEEEEEEEVNENGDEDMKATGLDCKDEEISAGKFLMGLIGY